MCVDADTDGYYAPPTIGCGWSSVPDCNDGDGSINPGEFEDLDSPEDDNCNLRKAMLPMFGEVNFPAAQWASTGTVTRLADEVHVGSPSATTESTLTRTVAIPLNVSVKVAIQVESTPGTGLQCRLRLGTTTPGTIFPMSWADEMVVSAGLLMLDFQGDIAPGRTLRKVQLVCPDHRGLYVDWLQIQDSDLVFGPLKDAIVDWRDTRHPSVDTAIAMIRDDGNGNLWAGTDTSGLALLDGTGWHVANGIGPRSLMAGGVIGVSDVLPMEDGSDDVFALTGDIVLDNGPQGGFWLSSDQGAHWDQLGASFDTWPVVSPEPAVPDHSDDVAAYDLESNCAGSHPDRAWLWGGGHRLQGQSPHPISGEPVYIANGDWDNLGVSVYDGSTICPMATTGDSLPADRVGALLRVDAVPGATPILVVGYRAQVNDGASVFVCELPYGGVDCSGSTSADCQVVDIDPWGSPAAWDLSGVDVRDLQEDTWLSDVSESGISADWAGVLIADGGARPIDADLDGIGDDACDFHESAIHELFISDNGGVVTVEVAQGLATELDFPQVAAGFGQLTGISIDPLSRYVFASTPRSNGTVYAADRLYRVPAADLLDSGAPLWEAINSGQESPALPYWETDPYEWVRSTLDLDLSGAWMESEFHGEADPFPARSAPGAGYDTVWLGAYEFAASGVTEYAAIPGGNLNLWLVAGLADEWGNNEPLEAFYAPGDTTAQPEGDVKFVFWPTVDASRGATFQGVTVSDVAIAYDGNIWSAVGDQGIVHLDATTTSTSISPNGAEIDCLWHGWHTAANSIDVVEPLYREETFQYPVVWATLAENATDGNLQFIGVVRTMDNGETWNYAAAGWESATGQAVMAVNTSPSSPEEYGARMCFDLETTHEATHFPNTDSDTGNVSPAHAFSTGATNEEARDISTPSLGIPANIRGLNEQAAIVLFRPTEDRTVGTEPTDTGAVEYPIVSDGGLYLTIDGGGTWHPVEFDPGEGGCDEHETWLAGGFELIHPGSDSFWDPATDSATFELLYSVKAVNTGYTASTCSLARVTIVASPGDTDPIAATWAWYTLPSTEATNRDITAGACGVIPSSLAGAVPSLTGNDAILYGWYTRGGHDGYLRWAYGGACAFDLDTTDLTGQLTMIVDPSVSAYSIGAVAPHPQVADVWTILPVLDTSTMLMCTEQGLGFAAGFDTFATDCPYPWPLLVQGNASSSFMVTATKGPTGASFTLLTSEETSYPNARPSSAMWSEVGVPDDSADGQGSWLVVGTHGGGTWRGELTW